MRRLVPSLLAMLFTVASFGQKPDTPPRYNIPDLNKRATVLITPTVSDKVLFNELDGKTISLRVVVDSDGNVESVVPPAGFSEEARTASEHAARESKFQPLVVNGKAERYFGHLLYSFAYEKMDWFAFGTALESVHNFDNISVGPVAAKLTVRWAEEKARLEAIDSLKDINERIRTIAGMIDHFESKLSGRNKWLFKTAVVVRNATFWGMVGGRIDRPKLQSALGKISEVLIDIPPQMPEEFLTALRTLAEYKVDAEMGERELRQEIAKLQSGLRYYPRP